MAFKDRKLAKSVTEKPCQWCGWSVGRRHAAHIIDEGPEKEWNALSLCPNCSTVFDEVIRPLLFIALTKCGVQGLPKSWEVDNKLRKSKLDPMIDWSSIPEDLKNKLLKK
jgi:hypothetical protein